MTLCRREALRGGLEALSVFILFFWGILVSSGERAAGGETAGVGEVGESEVNDPVIGRVVSMH